MLNLVHMCRAAGLNVEECLPLAVSCCGGNALRSLELEARHVTSQAKQSASRAATPTLQLCMSTAQWRLL